MKITTEKLN